MWKSSNRSRLFWVVGSLLFAATVIVAAAQLRSMAAAALLHPPRVTRAVDPPSGCRPRTFEGAGIRLRGWYCEAAGVRRGSAIVLHGVADTRASVAGVAVRLSRQGLDVVAYDSRAHGESEGDACTYGYYEKQDLALVIERLPPGPVFLMGTSLGAAIALQAAADAPRVSGVVAAEVFSDLRTIAHDRAPRLVPDWMVSRVLREAAARARFVLDEVSPVSAARRIRVPVLLVHGARDVATTPDHSRRVLQALRVPKRLILVDGAGHNESLRSDHTWAEIEAWIESLVSGLQSLDSGGDTKNAKHKSSRDRRPRTED